jgi:hypothetical protein
MLAYSYEVANNYGIDDATRRVLAKTATMEVTRVADPDPYPDWIRIQSGQWIWIRIRIGNPDPDPEGQK